MEELLGLPRCGDICPLYNQFCPDVAGIPFVNDIGIGSRDKDITLFGKQLLSFFDGSRPVIYNAACAVLDLC